MSHEHHDTPCCGRPAVTRRSLLERLRRRPDIHVPAEPGRARLTRRSFVFAAVGASGVALVGCVGPNGTGLMLVPAADIEVMGLETWQRIRQETPPSRNVTLQRAASRVTNNILLAAGESPRAWEVQVFQGDEANAFALPGNKIGVFEGMFDYAEDEPQLATVIGHEIAHNQAQHAVQRVNTVAATHLVLTGINIALAAGNVRYANEIAAAFGAGAQFGVILPYSRNQELEADEIGLFNMARGGYDPRASVYLWRNMERAGPRPPEFLSTHPSPDNRIARLEQLMPRALDVYRRA
jgi:predicted Zn-dependent protease